MKPLRVVSLFSGGGFADLALYRASQETGIPVEVVLAVDSWPVAVRVYNANLPARAVVADVRRLAPGDLPPHDLAIGGPPCQSHSLVGPKDCRCHAGGPTSSRCYLADFRRLAAGSAYLMENVRPLLMPQSWSERFCALDFGDVTTRKRWFYSDRLLHVVRTPGPRRFGDIRERRADRLAAAARRESGAAPAGFARSLVRDGDALGSLRASSYHLSTNRAPDRAKKRGTAHLVAVSPCAADPEEDEGRCPSLLEMQRAHSVPEGWNWSGATGRQRGLLIANGWPVLMGTAVASAALRALAS